MKILLFVLFLMTVTTAADAYEEKKVVVGNPGSKNTVQINRFYVIGNTNPQNKSKIIIQPLPPEKTFPEERGEFKEYEEE